MNLLKTLLCFGVLFPLNQAIAQMDFSSERELNNYAYSNTNLQNVTNGYVLDWEINYDSKFWGEFYALQQDKSTYNIDHIFTMFSLMEKMDINTNHFEMDSILFPIMRSFYANDGFSAQNIPLYIFDLEVSKLKSEKANLVKTWENESPYPAFLQSDFEFQNLYATGVFTDTIVQNYIHFYWNDETFISNKNRTVEKVELKINGNNIELEKDTPYDVSSYYDEENALKQITIKVIFSNGEIKTNTQNIYLIKTPVYAQNKAYSEETIFNIGGSFDDNNPYDNTILQYQVHYGCDDDQVLDKPYILVAGWGTFTNKKFINNAQGWPTPFSTLYNQFNLAGFIDELREANYDVIIARFIPPNEDIGINSDLLEDLINWVNVTKVNNGSHEENIVHGYSAGALCAKYTLLRMEKEYFTIGGTQHHSKLFVSFEGENGGGNIPLGMQHCLEYLEENHASSATLGWTIYTLHYALNAPLTLQLLREHYSETGTTANPGQDEHPLRTNYIANQTQNNHAKTGSHTDFPMCRNIVVSNGQNESGINGSTSNHTPYHAEEGHIFFEQNNNNRQWKAKFSEAGGGQVFYYKKKQSGSWNIIMEGYTDANTLNLDNAPGGTMFTGTGNPMFNIGDKLDGRISGDPDLLEIRQFCFTPTIFTVDIQNYNPAATNRRLQYSLKENGLMFQHYNDINNNSLASNFYGYPHLKHPNNHYSGYTPFDAVFAWSENTEHIRSKLVGPYNNGLVVTYSPIFTGAVKNFLVNEADIYNSYLQNVKYGYHARPADTYVADIKSPHQIFIGKNVTQRTDFKPVEVQQNAIVDCQAAESVNIKPGFHALSGCSFHAQILPYGCVTTKSMVQNNPNQNGTNSKLIEPLSTKTNIEAEKQTPLFLVYPNPSTGIVYLELQNSPNNPNFTYQIYNLSGKLVYSGQSDTGTEPAVVRLNLEKGLYLIRLQQNNTSYTQKLVVY